MAGPLGSTSCLRVTYVANVCPSRIVLLNYREDGITPYIIVWKHGLREEKV
jgi:hypothetical protein